MKHIRYFFIFILSSLPTMAFSAHLPDDIEPGDGVNEIQLPLTKESAAELIRLESQGKVLSVDKKPFKEGFIFRVKVLHDDGTVKHYRLDPITGHRPH